MWHIDAEIISLIFMLVIVFDTFKTNTVKSLKDNLFNALAITTIFAILIDIISSVAMTQYQTFPWWSIQGSLLLYLIATPMLSMLWQLYAIAVISKASRQRKRKLFITTIPFMVYIMIVFSNPVTGWMFNLSATNEYTRGILFNSIFVIFYGYSIATLLLSCINYRKIERITNIVFTIFPLIAGTGVLLQQLLPGYLVTGASFTLVLLITYLFLQNRKATRDSLTGLNNRMSFSTAIEKLSKKEEHGFLLTAALDDFKMFNQTFGQNKGDMLLRQVAEYFTSVSPNKTAYRYGGDIFTIILKKSNEQETFQIVNTIMERFSHPFLIDGMGYSVSTCVGVVEYPSKSTNTKHSIISAMDFAGYQAKKRGKGQVAFFNEDLVKQFKRKHAISVALTKAIKNQSFEIYIQPIYNTQKKKFTYGEALLRLTDDELGAISPAEFIPIAEETSQILEITYFVLGKTCDFIKRNRPILDDKICISVNFSIVQFMHNNIVEEVTNIIKSYNIPPNLIKIEITESIIADSFDDIRVVMKTLNDFGIEFALDDYGQGYSNISYLINLPFTYVKLDKSIIDNILTNQQFISALIPMFRSLDKIIISEGVETKEQADILENLSCDAIQGYYFARPMPMETSLDFFKASE